MINTTTRCFSSLHFITKIYSTMDSSTPNNGPLDEVQWKHPEWIQENGLRTDNVLEYFSLSPFYDRSSNNQVLKMQSQYNDMHSGNDLYSKLQNMKGLEFVVAIAHEPNLWVIRKQERLSPDVTRPISTYFVVGENIYMAPAVHSIIENRVLSIALSLSQALRAACSLPTFSPSQGYIYKNDPQLLSSVDKSSSEKDPNITPAEERQAYYNIDVSLNHALSNTTLYLEDSINSLNRENEEAMSLDTLQTSNSTQADDSKTKRRRKPVRSSATN